MPEAVESAKARFVRSLADSIEAANCATWISRMSAGESHPLRIEVLGILGSVSRRGSGSTGRDNRWQVNPHSPSFDAGPSPYVRWWWLAGPFLAEDIHFQLDWVKGNGFGGVELAWIWPRWYGAFDESSIPRWLSPEWSAIIGEAKRYADQIGIGCDFTFGSCWPFGGSCVTKKTASQTFDGLSNQRLTASWEEALERPLFVLNHLSRYAFNDDRAVPAAGFRILPGRGTFCPLLRFP